MISLRGVVARLEQVEDYRHIGTVGEMSQMIASGFGTAALPAAFIAITGDNSEVRESTRGVSKQVKYTITIYSAMLDIQEQTKGQRNLEGMNALREKLHKCVEGNVPDLGLLYQVRGEMQTGMPDGVIVYLDNFEVTTKGRTINV